jgi:hypothetical protein
LTLSPGDTSYLSQKSWHETAWESLIGFAGEGGAVIGAEQLLLGVEFEVAAVRMVAAAVVVAVEVMVVAGKTGQVQDWWERAGEGDLASWWQETGQELVLEQGGVAQQVLQLTGRFIVFLKNVLILVVVQPLLLLKSVCTSKSLDEDITEEL